MDPSQMMNRSFPMWAPPPAPAAPPPHSDDPAAAPFLPPPNRGWKRKMPPAASGYQPPALGDLEVQNRAKARRWFKNPINRKQQQQHSFFPKNNKNKAAAPRNTTSFIIRAKRAGGIASLVSPCPVTPAILPTPRLSPSREGLADMAQAQWGVDGYGSMKGLIRLRASSRPASNSDDDDENDDSSGGSDVEEHVEVERRLDHDLSRFEMVYPANTASTGENYLFQEDDDDYDQDARVARLEEENLTLKERLFLMEQEVGDMRRRLEALEARFSLPSDAVAGGHPPPPPPENDVERVHVHLDTREEDNAVDKIGEEEYARNEGSEKKVRQSNAEKDGAGDSEKSNGQNAEMEGAEDSEKNEDAEEEGALVLEKIDSAEKEVAVISEKSNNAEEEGVVVSEKSNEHIVEMVDALVEQKSSEDDAEESRH